MKINEFHINCDKFHSYSDKSTDWFIKSWRYKHSSDEWKVCRLKQKINNKKAMKHLKLAEKCLND